MSSIKQKITKPYSRMMNGLAELQRWWPCFVKNDGVGGLTTYPVLYETNFGPNTVEDEGIALIDEGNTAGIRVECIADDGTAVSTTQPCKVVISGSGTFEAKARVHHPTSGDWTDFMFIAPSADGKDGHYYNGGSAQTLAGSGAMPTPADSTTPANAATHTQGPYPVFATIQDFVEFLDGAVNTVADGAFAETVKKAFLPQGLISPSTARWPNPESEPRSSGATALPNPSQFRATVFMPLMLDNNQLNNVQINDSDSNDITKGRGDGLTVETGTGSTNTYFNFYDEGLTRHDTKSTILNTPTLKVYTESGDFLLGAVGSFQSFTTYTTGDYKEWTDNYGNADIDPSSSAYGGPSYRMRTALACFLKDGEYTMTDGGSFIPYIYDPSRSIGGYETNTMYAVWNGEESKSLSTAELRETDKQSSAQIFPCFDFVQGPICPPAQGLNYDYDNTDGQYVDWMYYTSVYSDAGTSAEERKGAPRCRLLRPNPIRSPVYAVARTSPDDGGEIWIYVEDASGSRDDPNYKLAMPINLKGIDGVLKGGPVDVDTGRTQTQWNGYGNSGTIGVSSTALGYDFNGWWIVSSVEDLSSVAKSTLVSGATGTFTGQKLIIRLNMNDAGSLGTVLGYETPSATVSQGIQGGAELKDDWSQTLTNHANRYSIPLRSSETLDWSRAAYGFGYLGGLNQANQNVPSAVGNQATYPCRITMFPATTWNEESGWRSATKYTQRGIEIVKSDDLRYGLSPTVAGSGGGALRIPAPQDSAIAMRYWAVSLPASILVSGNLQNVMDMSNPSVGTIDQYRYSVGPNFHKWRRRGLHVPLISKMDNLSGVHAWTDTLPHNMDEGDSWTWGRNRPIVPHERCGTKMGYGPLRKQGRSPNWAITNKGLGSSTGRPAIGDATTYIGLTEIGCSPMWLDMEIKGYIPINKNTMTIIEFDTGEEFGAMGRHAMYSHPYMTSNAADAGFLPLWDGDGNINKETSAYTEAGPINTKGFTAIWMWGDPVWFKSGWANTTTDPANGWPFTTTNGGRFGDMGNNIGTGGTFSMTEGFHTIRTTFDIEGMTLSVDGTLIGKDLNCNDPVWGITITQASAGGGANPEQGTPIVDEHNTEIRPDAPTFQKSQADLQIDFLSLRHIPSKVMVPFTCDTLTQNISGIAKYTNLIVECENINTSKGMNLKVSLLEPVANTGPQIEGGAVIEGFEELDLGFIGGYGSVDISRLPTSVYSTGFVIQFRFYVPTANDTDQHPVDWTKTPIVRSWTIGYDLAPTATIVCIGNTYNGDITAPINTKVGHIISLRGTATTTDPDRKVSKVKFDFGDGTQTDWLTFADQTQQTNTHDTAHTYLTVGTYDAKVYVQDDNANQVESASISIVVANAAPVAVLRAVPSLIRAGQAITLDGGDSYDLNAGGSISDYAWTFGDTSSGVNGGASSVQHTYAVAGEYQASLIVKDADGTDSQTATCVIKVLPATLVVPLVFNTKPRAFNRNRGAAMSQTTVLDAVYPEITDRGNRTDEFSLQGLFLKSTANADIAFVEELLLSGSLVEFMWEDVDYQGSTTGKVFTGRITSFDYQREGGQHGSTPYTLNLVREAGLGV